MLPLVSEVPLVVSRSVKLRASVLRSTSALITPLGALRPTSTFTPGTPRFISDWEVDVPVLVAAEGFGFAGIGRLLCVGHAAQHEERGGCDRGA
jgi:hypothetical protein